MLLWLRKLSRNITQVKLCDALYVEEFSLIFCIDWNQSLVCCVCVCVCLYRRGSEFLSAGRCSLGSCDLKDVPQRTSRAVAHLSALQRHCQLPQWEHKTQRSDSNTSSFQKAHISAHTHVCPPTVLTFVNRLLKPQFLHLYCLKWALKVTWPHTHSHKLSLHSLCVVLSDVDTESQAERIRNMLTSLPEENYASLRFLIQFLAQVILKIIANVQQ